LLTAVNTKPSWGRLNEQMSFAEHLLSAIHFAQAGAFEDNQPNVKSQRTAEMSNAQTLQLTKEVLNLLILNRMSPPSSPRT